MQLVGNIWIPANTHLPPTPCGGQTGTTQEHTNYFEDRVGIPQLKGGEAPHSLPACCNIDKIKDVYRF